MLAYGNTLLQCAVVAKLPEGSCGTVSLSRLLFFSAQRGKTRAGFQVLSSGNSSGWRHFKTSLCKWGVKKKKMSSEIYEHQSKRNLKQTSCTMVFGYFFHKAVCLCAFVCALACVRACVYIFHKTFCRNYLWCWMDYLWGSSTPTPCWLGTVSQPIEPLDRRGPKECKK